MSEMGMYFLWVSVGLTVTAVTWLAVRIQRYGMSALQRRSSRLKRAHDEATAQEKSIAESARQQLLQDTADEVLRRVNDTVKTLTEKNDGHSVVDQFDSMRREQVATAKDVSDRLDAQAAKVENRLDAQAAKVENRLTKQDEIQSVFHDDMVKRLGIMQGNIGDLSTVVVGLVASSDKTLAATLVVDQKITQNGGSLPGIGDVVGDIRETQLEHIVEAT